MTTSSGRRPGTARHCSRSPPGPAARRRRGAAGHRRRRYLAAPRTPAGCAAAGTGANPARASRCPPSRWATRSPSSPWSPDGACRPRAAIIAVTTAYAESGLINSATRNRPRLGRTVPATHLPLHQGRSPTTRSAPATPSSTGSFSVPDWDTLPVGDAAQAVQHLHTRPGLLHRAPARRHRHRRPAVAHRRRAAPVSAVAGTIDPDRRERRAAGRGLRRR